VIVRRTERGWAVGRVARASVCAFEEKWPQRIGADQMQQFRGALKDFIGTSVADEKPAAP
jgi:hypothetical protein